MGGGLGGVGWGVVGGKGVEWGEARWGGAVSSFCILSRFTCKKAAKTCGNSSFGGCSGPAWLDSAGLLIGAAGTMLWSIFEMGAKAFFGMIFGTIVTTILDFFRPGCAWVAWAEL